MKTSDSFSFLDEICHKRTKMGDKRNGGVHNPRMLSNIAFTARFEIVSAIRVLTYVFQDLKFFF